MVRVLLLLIFVASTGANAQIVMDGSGAALNKESMAKLKSILNDVLSDPYGSQLQKLKSVSPNAICGSINIRNSYGGLTRFRSFGADLAQGKIEIVPDDPGYDIEKLNTKEELEAARNALQGRLSKLQAVKALCGP